MKYKNFTPKNAKDRRFSFGIEPSKAAWGLAMFVIKTVLLNLVLTLFYYIISTTIINSIIMGVPHFRFSRTCRMYDFLITKLNRIDFQNGKECSAFSAAYVLRHWNIEKHGEDLYKIMPNKRMDGSVYPKGIVKLLSQYGFDTTYCIGTINALKNEVSKGTPVIVLIRTYKDANYLHFVPVVGYNQHDIFIADSLKELANCKEQYYNRKIPIKEFKRLWNTSMLKMPLYRNIYIVASKK